jgi:negative regulator of flagellin synthesis FlgM
MVSEVNAPSSGIVSINEVQNRFVDNSGPASKVTSPPVAPVVSSETVVITEAAAKFHAIEKAISKQPEVDHTRVEAIKQSIADGSYKIDPQSIAEKLLQFESMVPGANVDQ